MPKEEGECRASGRQSKVETGVNGPMDISPEVYQLLKNASIPSEFKEVVREVIPNMNIPYPTDLESSETSPEKYMTSIEIPMPEVSIPPVEMPVESVPVSWTDKSISDRGVNAFYLTDLKLDLTRTADLTPALRALARVVLRAIVLNNPAWWGKEERGPGADGAGIGTVTNGEGEGEILLEKGEPIGETTGEFIDESTTPPLVMDRVITGFTIPPESSKITSRTVTLKVDPPDRAATVCLTWLDPNNRAQFDETFRSSGTNSCPCGIVTIPLGTETITPACGIWRDATEGTIRFKIKGMSATPKDKPKGDAALIAEDRGVQIARLQIVVVVPKEIATPHPTFDGIVDGVNVALSVSSTPALIPGDPNSPDPGNVALATAFYTNLVITVNDQFGDTLNAIYVGTSVTQEAGQPINQQITEKGTYNDPVGSQTFLGQAPKVQATADNLAALQRVLAPEIDKIQNKGVEVGGHPLNPAIVNRSVKFEHLPQSQTELKGRLIITWPN